MLNRMKQDGECPRALNPMSLLAVWTIRLVLFSITGCILGNDIRLDRVFHDTPQRPPRLPGYLTCSIDHPASNRDFNS